MMKKMTKLVSVVALALPLAFATPLAASASTQATQTTQATKAKKYSYTIKKSYFYKKAKTYHTKDASPTVYKAAIGADTSSFVLTKKGKLKSATTYYVTKAVKTDATKTKKSKTFFYVKGHGWVAASALTAGQFKQAD
ncbi:hypothetical protein ACFQ22_04430 [Lentilactobacillus raoultii]|uniref:Surface layer protein A domain-containing protein n=2 Tax=Lentilactobacillus raoultii TaxID=1987503 RepID=A0ABW3PEM2_9LACO